MLEIDQTGVSPNTSGRYGARPRLFVLHTQEGGGSARSLAGFLQNPASQVSYHYSIDNETCIDVVDTDRASWSVLDANPYSINLCFAGSRASQSREVWLDQFGQAIDYAAFLFVQDAKKYGMFNRTIPWADISAGKSGGTDHYGITRGLGIGNHTDVGPNFPWDVYAAALAKHSTPALPPPVPAPNAIAEAHKANPWLGAKVTKELELSTPDGRGKFAAYEKGHIYWTPTTGARAIPAELFASYEAYGFEAGPLGYPVNDRTVLKDGLVQAFENGTLYRKNGDRGYFVHGEIGNRWYRSGFENGAYGWAIGNEVPFDGGAYQDFENGRIYWPGSRKTIGLLNADGADIPVSDKD